MILKLDQTRRMEGGSSRKPFLVVILIRIIYAGMFLLSKAAFNSGMNTFVFVFYRQAAATLFLVPLALFLEWRTAPPMSFMTFCKIFLLSFVGITLSLDINAVGLVYTSATLAAAISNSLPVITFLLALLLRVEVLKPRTSSGMAKIAGILFCTAGAVTLALYKGPHFNLLGSHSLFHHHNTQEHESHVHSGKTWIKGCFLMLISTICWGVWLVFQALVMKGYPSKLIFTALQCFLSSIQAFVIAIVVERNPYEWKLGWNLKLVAIAYCVNSVLKATFIFQFLMWISVMYGIVVTGFTYHLQAWVIEKKDPVFLATSTPLSLVITLLASAILLGESITLGSFLGGLFLVGGLYSVLWAKSKEQSKVDESCLETEEVVKESSQLTEAKDITSV